MSCRKGSLRTARVMRVFCLLLLWGVTLSSSTLLRPQSTPIESMAEDNIQQKTRTPATRQLDDKVNGSNHIEKTDGGNSTPEVPVAAAPPTSNTTGPGNEDPDVIANDSGNPPETDPCADVDSCEACQTAAASVTETDKTCWWDWGDSICSKKEVEAIPLVDDMCDAPPAVVAPPTASTTVTARPTVSPTISPSQHPTTPSPSKAPTVVAPVIPPPQNDPDEEEEGLGVPNMLAIAFVGVILLLAIRAIRNRCCNRNAGNMRSSKQSGRYQEISTDEQDKDEEWGWGDDEPTSPGSSGLELNTLEKKDDDYMSDSLFDSDNVGDVVKTKSFALRNTNLIQRTSSGERGAMSQSPTPVSSPKNKVDPPPPMRAAQQVVKKAQPAPAPKPKADDFFADMGFSAKPTFSHGPTSPSPAASRNQAAPRSSPLPVSGNGASRWQATGTSTTTTTAAGTGSLVGRPATTTTTSTTRSLGASALAADSDDDLGADNWDDDGDLDDLLDD